MTLLDYKALLMCPRPPSNREFLSRRLFPLDHRTDHAQLGP